jgi:hypothetical protein
VISNRLSTAQRWLHYYTIILGILLLIWLPFEDSNEQLATTFAAAISAGLAVRLVIKRIPPQPTSLLKHLILGSGFGLAIAPLTFLLMALKTGLHGHTTPEFTSVQVIAVFQRAPLWGLGGLLIGLGVSLWRR